MTPQERQMIDDLFDRLAKLESAPRDPEATAAIVQGLRNAPNAVYALVQTVLVQDEALKRANSRIQELEAAGAGQPQPSGGGFLDSMRETIFGQGQPRGSVPNVPPPAAPASRPVWNSGQVMQQAQSPGHYDQPPYGQPYGAPQGPVGGGGSFLGTAAAAAAGMVGGSLLLGGIRSMMGGGHHALGTPSAFGDTASQSPLTDQSGSTLAQDAGIKDIGGSADRADDASRAGLYDTASNDDAGPNDDDDDHDDTDMDSDDFGGDGDSDYA
ncbi:MAG TPA: DUF2076 domain-containing protein [Bradyrhizobium sp.]|nr:DUF2076 domain-containing protein [Bradyrhizobium sp.]